MQVPGVWEEMRNLLTSCNHIYLGIMLTTAFLFFTLLDGKNQLLLALLKCTGKRFSFFTKQHTQEVPKAGFFCLHFFLCTTFLPRWKRTLLPFTPSCCGENMQQNWDILHNFFEPMDSVIVPNRAGILRLQPSTDKDHKCARRTQLRWGHQEPVTTHQTLCLQSKGQVFTRSLGTVFFNCSTYLMSFCLKII